VFAEHQIGPRAHHREVRLTTLLLVRLVRVRVRVRVGVGVRVRVRVGVRVRVNRIFA